MHSPLWKRLLRFGSALFLVSLLLLAGAAHAPRARAASVGTLRLSADTDIALAGQPITLRVRVFDSNGQPFPGIAPNISIVDKSLQYGIEDPQISIAPTGLDGVAQDTVFPRNNIGTLVLQATLTDTNGTISSNTVSVGWTLILVTPSPASALTNHPVPLTITVVDNQGLPQIYKPVTLSPICSPCSDIFRNISQSGVPSTDPNGTAQVSIQVEPLKGNAFLSLDFQVSAPDTIAITTITTTDTGASQTTTLIPITAQSNIVQVNWTPLWLTSPVTQEPAGSSSVPLTVTVVDGFGNPVSGVTPTLVAINGPDVAVQENPTDQNGQAQDFIAEGSLQTGTTAIVAEVPNGPGAFLVSNALEITWVDQSSLTLTAATSTPLLGTNARVTATALGPDRQPAPGARVSFTIVYGPHAGPLGTFTTDSTGQASVSYSVVGLGTDLVQASYIDSDSHIAYSNAVQVTWLNNSSITLAPPTTTQNLGSPATLTASARGIDGNPAVGATVTFSVVSGPDAGATDTAAADSNGQATFFLTNKTGAGTDTIQASFTDSAGTTQTSSQVQVTWVGLTVTGQSINAIEGSSFSTTVATVTGVLGTPSATIDWGDGTTSTGTLTANSDGSFTLSGSHIYAEEGSYTVSISATDSKGQSGSGSATASVADAPLSVNSLTLNRPAEGTVGLEAHFSDADTGGTLSDYHATIQWGDGTTSQATIRVGSNGEIYIVTSSHKYAKTGTYTITLTLQDVGGNSVTSTQSFSLK